MTDRTGGPTVTLAGGIEMPLLGLGTWQAKGRQGYDAFRYAIDVGYRHIDTATMYANEAEVGRAVRDSGVPRGEVFITTKLPPSQAGRERRTLDRSLRELGTDYVDLWLVHWPPGDRAAPQTWQEFLAAQRDGLTRAVGVSNYSTAQIDELIEVTGQAPAVNQIPWGPSLYDETRVAHSRDRGVVLEGYSPLKNSNLADPVLTRIAASHDVTPAQVVLRWHIDHGVVVIPKSVRPERIGLNLDVFGFSLDDEEIGEMDALSR